ncbi:putative f-box domain protein [Mycena sanguinolenta]|uniref:Putative f-box domain protein n=1 Tax=Mycena sanguinolenta TaxID=230812 RepID=A0A8H6YY28_9AGAR|nr:putative f-box domain protein [Mycena sanguinolenta]
MSPTRARDATTSTPELLELILAHLPMRDLLVTAPLVCKTWQALALTPALQRVLFFEPVPLSSSAPMQNPLLAELFPPFFTAVAQDTHWARLPGSARSIKSMPWSKSPAAFKRAEASWRRMLVAQPPPLTMIVAEKCYGQSGAAERRTALTDISPLRMGSLYDIALPFADADTDSFFCVLWRDGDVETDSEGDITLAVTYTESTRQRRGLRLDERFYSDAFRDHANLEIAWGEMDHTSLWLNAN